MLHHKMPGSSLQITSLRLYSSSIVQYHRIEKMLKYLLLFVAVVGVSVAVTIVPCGPRFECPLDVNDECTNPHCKACPLPNGKIRCRTEHRDCLVADTMELDVTKKNCEKESEMVWCEDFRGGSGKCIMAEPTRRSCFRQRGPPRGLVANDLYTGETSCNEAGHLWCGNDVRESNRQTCFNLPEPIFPSGPKCDDDEHSCCKTRTCIPIPPGEVADDLRQRCAAKGCKMCGPPGEELCVFGTIPATTEDKCDAFNYELEDCYETLTGNPNEADCKAMGCKWCSQRDYSFYCVREHPAVCEVDDKPACKKPDADTYDECKLWGCEWCGHCQESTECTTCNCPDRVDCDAVTKDACEMKKCKWCEDADDFKCMNVNSEGVNAIGVWTECTKTCGCGTKWQYDASCQETNPLNCDRIYMTCNEQDCPSTCATAEIQRHQDSLTCCADHTWECGRNTLNQVHVEEPSTTRKKRVSGGDDIGSIKKWPWLTFIDTRKNKCGGALVSKEHVVTSSKCLGDAGRFEILLHFDSYDRSMDPGIEIGAKNVSVYQEIAIITLEVPFERFGECVSPICLPRREIVQEDMKCFIAGWGRTDYSDATGADRAHDAMVKILPRGMCEQSVVDERADDLKEEFNMQNYFCAGLPEGGKDACIGDAGGPIMCQRCENCGWYLAGVATVGTGCGMAGQPTVYARVSSYEEWIEEIVPVLDSNTYQCPSQEPSE